MRNLLAACVAIIVILAIVTGNLWLELRSERRVIAELRSQMAVPKVAEPLPAQAPVLQPVAAVEVALPVAAPTPEPKPAAAPAPVVQMTSAAAINQALASRPAPVITESRRADAMLQSDQTATARVMAWRDRLSLAGQTLTTEQLQALNAAATAQLRRETEQTLEVESTTPPRDVDSMVRMREEAINRQNETNMRILRAVSGQLTEEQAKALRAQFDSGHAARMAAFRTERDELLRQIQ